jgi:hypothetical protein
MFLSVLGKLAQFQFCLIDGTYFTGGVSRYWQGMLFSLQKEHGFPSSHFCFRCLHCSQALKSQYTYPRFSFVVNTPVLHASACASDHRRWQKLAHSWVHRI